jgi:fibronectin type 3 domain-containing protein
MRFSLEITRSLWAPEVKLSGKKVYEGFLTSSLRTSASSAVRFGSTAEAAEVRRSFGADERGQVKIDDLMRFHPGASDPRRSLLPKR